MGLIKAVSTCFTKFADTNGRASRSEFWFFMFFLMLVSIAVAVGDVILFAHADLLYLFWISMLLPAVSVLARRLHDINRSAWWAAVVILPFVGSTVLFVWLWTKGTKGQNQFDIVEYRPEPQHGARAL